LAERADAALGVGLAAIGNAGDVVRTDGRKEEEVESSHHLPVLPVPRMRSMSQMREVPGLQHKLQGIFLLTAIMQHLLGTG
jgi:hypothetical protein